MAPTGTDAVAATPDVVAELFDAYAPVVYRYARARLSEADAQDVVAEVFVIAWRRREEQVDHPAAWLLAVARRVMANQFRARDRQLALVGRLAGRRPAADDDETELTHELDLLRRALARLRPADREVVELLAAAELTTAEVAAVLGCTAAAAATRVHRARQRLARAYEAVEGR
ncbi:RNA polymerase sigma factor [Actinotalea subterranea]|uniref:RNA polymerase sigma factor n=1 Tax=Actinotalea subterranea TaxID=2607497 RepID=UPI0011F0951E|nr:RNA polymerase sigma factor [Actinotalea subterranea]